MDIKEQVAIKYHNHIRNFVTHGRPDLLYQIRIPGRSQQSSYREKQYNKMFADNYHAGQKSEVRQDRRPLPSPEYPAGEWDRWYRQHRHNFIGFAHGNKNIFGHLTRSGQQPDLFVDRHGLNHFFSKGALPSWGNSSAQIKREENKKIEKIQYFYHSTRFKNSAKFCISIRFTTFSILKYFLRQDILICIKKSYQPVSGF